MANMLYLYLEMAPYLLLGFLIAGILHAFVPQTLYRKWLAGDDLKSVLLSLLFGIPLPLCSCGVIPTAVSMRKEGASRGATTAFLIGTPQTGVDSIAATYSVLGLPFAILRPVAALVTGLFGGIITNRFADGDSPQSDSAECQVPAALMLKGLSPGAALVFLMAGPATNMASLLVMGKTLGRRQTIIYLVSIIAGAIAFGMCADYLMPREWFTGRLMSDIHSHCHHTEGTAVPWWQIASGIVLGALLTRAMILRFGSKKTQKTNKMKFKVTGMMCNHCKAHVKNAIEAVKGVTAVEVDLASGIATVEGDASAQDVIAAVEATGYSCSRM